MNTGELAISILKLFPAFFALIFVSSPFWLRVINEVTTRTISEAVVITPPFIPRVIETENPEVFR